ncbi:YceD family protein [Paludibacterium yongneupense]|uniref:YceD family protein n=1 Tax=Paludibacterium yongneupense TaxID=400061 RepID=UPI00040774A2|nr:YceD family protein [Paludibacterium yongneupense]
MSNPILIDPLKYAREGRAQSGKMAVAALDERVLAELAGRDGEVEYTLTGYVDRLRRPCLRLELAARVLVVCGRCLEAMFVDVKADSVVTLFTSEERLLAAVEDDEELDAIIAEPELDARALIEDEIIMGLPLSPLHDDCGSEELERARAKKPNPFAVLASLKTSRSE